MKIILLKDVRGVGQHGDVKTVADGYAINMLFPQRLAEAATEAKMAEIESKKKEHEAEAKKIEGELDNKVKQLRGKRVVLQARATEKGGLFKAISAKDVARAILAEHSLEIPEDSITFPEQIKTVGDHVALLSSNSQKVEIAVAIVAAT